MTIDPSLKTVAGRAPGDERLVLLEDGGRGFEELVTLIDTAEADLKLLFYTFAGDATGLIIRDRLLAAQARGVAVSLIVDDFGSFDTPDEFFKPLGDAGCRFCRFQPRLFQRYLLRNHQKIAIADNVRAIVGSFNIGDRHMNTDAKGWRDVGVYVEGPAGARLGRYFDVLELWTKSKRPRMRRLGRLLAAANEDTGSVRWIFGGPSRGYNNYARQVNRVLGTARSVDLIMAYFTPSPRILGAVRRLARMGRFRLIAAGKTDVKLSRAAAWHTYRTLLRAGARIYEYQPRLLHSKIIIADDAVFIGSGNFDVRSLYVNLEVMLRVDRADFVNEVRKLFETELADSLPVDLAKLKARQNWLKRRWSSIAYFLMVTVDSFFSRRFAR